MKQGAVRKVRFKVGGAWRFRRDEIERFTKGEYMLPSKSGADER